MLGSQILIKTLVKAGVKKIFSLSGNQIMSIYDSCIDEKIEIIHTRHEAAAVSMAEAWSQLTKQIGVVLVTAAQGYTNALGPLFSVQSSDTPILLISGDSSIEQDGKGAFQELDQISIASKLTKLSIRVKNIIDLEEILRQAIRTAISQKPGPVHIAIPENILDDKIKNKTTINAVNFEKHKPKLKKNDIDFIYKEMMDSLNPLIILGPSLSDTRTDGLSDITSKCLNVPSIVMESPRGINDPSLGKLKKIFKECDKIFCFSKSIDFTLKFGDPKIFVKNCKWILISSESQEYKRAKINLKNQPLKFVLSDPLETLKALFELKKQNKNKIKDSAWVKKVRKTSKLRPKILNKDNQITSSELCFIVQNFIKINTPSIVISDGGEFGQWAQSLTNSSKRIITMVSFYFRLC